MKITALLSWYDEDPAWLTRCITSLAQIPVDALIALDGAYQHYPNPHGRSDPAQARAIIQAARDAGITELHVNCTGVVWESEIDKRNALFALAEEATSPDDWYMVIDADEFVTHAPPDVHAKLDRSPFDVAGVTLNEPGHPMGTIRFDTFPMFFRAIRGTRCAVNHYTYVTPDGRKLWGNAKTDRLEPRHDLTELVVEHHSQLRYYDRRRAALDYYETRDALGIEELPADRSLLKDPT